MLNSPQATPLTDDALTPLSAVAHTRAQGGLAYAGEVLPQEAMAYMSAHPALLVDVRTPEEWQATGVADVPGKALSISWKTNPGYVRNPNFVAELSHAPGVTPDTPLFFLCRSGGRSLDAAVAMTAAGYRHCFNVIGGFEGEANAQGQRGTVSGWKAANLPVKKG